MVQLGSKNRAITVADLVESFGPECGDVAASPDQVITFFDHPVILGSDERKAIPAGSVVFIIGASNDSDFDVSAVLNSRPAAIVVRGPTNSWKASQLRCSAEKIGLVVLRQDAIWQQLFDELQDLFRTQRPNTAKGSGDLYSIAETLATLTGGHVIIEDNATRVLGYSAVSDDVDEMRRLSILRRQGPQGYLNLLKSQHVFDHLRIPHKVLFIDAFPDEGVRKRAAIGVHAGKRMLGHIWVQERDKSFDSHTETILIGAATLVANQIVSDLDPAANSGSFDRFFEADKKADSLFRQRGIDPQSPFGLIRLSPWDNFQDQAADALRLEDLKNLISIHAATFNYSVAVGMIGNDLVVIVGNLVTTDSSACMRLATKVLSDAGKLFENSVTIALGPVALTSKDLASSLSISAQVAYFQKQSSQLQIASPQDVQYLILSKEVTDFVGSMHSPLYAEIDQLMSQSPEVAETLLAYLDAFGDAKLVAERLGIHRNTVHYRIRQAVEASGIDLAKPEARIITQLRLRALEDQANGLHAD